MKATFEDTAMRKILPLQIEQLKSSLVGKITVRGTPRKGATANRYLQLLSKVFSMAYDNGFVDSNPSKRVRKEKEGGGRNRYLTWEEQSRLISVLTGRLEFLSPAIFLSINTGMRRSELLRLSINDINFSKITQFRSVTGGVVVIPANHLLVIRGKNGDPRLIPMNKIARSTLELLAQDASDTDRIFSVDRNGISYSTIRDGFEAACNAAGLTFGQAKEGGIVWHDLRHTFATRLRDKGVPEFEIMELMGHSTFAMTARYAHSNPGVMQKAVDRITERDGDVLEFGRSLLKRRATS